MPFEILVSNPEKAILIDSSLDKITQNLNGSLHKDMPIVFIDYRESENYFEKDQIKLIEKGLQNGLGLLFANVIHSGSRKHFIILNFEKIESLVLNDAEFAGVIAHELGHIFNEPVPFIDLKDVITSQMLSETISADEYKTRMSENNSKKDLYLNEKEFYADYFAVLVNCKDGLVSSIIKFMSQENAPNVGLFNLRLEKLRNDKVYNGSIKKIKSL